MQSSTRNPYDIVTEGIISTIPINFSLAKVLQIVNPSKFSQISSWFNIFTKNPLSMAELTEAGCGEAAF